MVVFRRARAVDCGGLFFESPLWNGTKSGRRNHARRNRSLAQKNVAECPETSSGRGFPRLLEDAEKAGFEHADLADVVDEWLNYGYCRIVDHVANDIELTLEGERYFGGRLFEDD